MEAYVLIFLSTFTAGLGISTALFLLQPKPKAPSRPASAAASLVPGMLITNSDGSQTRVVDVIGPTIRVHIVSADGLYIAQGQCEATAFWDLYKEQNRGFPLP